MKMKRLKMQLFGRVSLAGEKGELDEDALRSGKLTSLLAYVVIHRDQILTQQKLIEIFWEDGSRKPENALRNLMYRLRNAMKALGDEKFIMTLPGAYRWNPEIQVETDYETFESEAAKLKRIPGDIQQEETAEQKELCTHIIDIYYTGGGNVSGKISGETWMLPKTMWYQSLYLEAVKILCQILCREGNWQDLEETARRAVEEDPFDEDLYCWLVQSMHRQKKYSAAMLQYERAKNTFYEGMGIRNVEKLQKVFQEMMTDSGESVMDIGMLTMDVSEPRKPKGTFFCDYQVFREIYRLEARRVARAGTTEYVMLLTVRRTGRLWKQAVADSGLMEGLKILEGQISILLRACDVAARCSPTQISVLLIGCSYENGIRIGKRIQENFYKHIGKRQIELVYELEEICQVQER